jgi:biuret amidohydrolase
MTTSNGHSNSVNVEVEDLKPGKASFDLAHTALIIIDMQVDFMCEGGFGSLLGNDVSKLQRAVGPCQTILNAARQASMLVIHTREGHRGDMTDVHSHKVKQTKNVIGAPGRE